jgi:hypothetical protein
MANKGFVFWELAEVWQFDCHEERRFSEVLVCGGAFVKILRCLLILCILGLSSSAALANGIPDPGLGVKGGTGSTLWPGSVTFTINPTTTGSDCSAETTCNFISPAFFINTGTITNFDFNFATTPQITGFSVLADSVFPTLTIVNATTEAILSGGTISPACDCSNTANHIFGDFYFELQGVLNPTVVTITSNVPVPEPGTMILMLSGLGAMGLRRLRRNKVSS